MSALNCVRYHTISWDYIIFRTSNWDPGGLDKCMYTEGLHFFWLRLSKGGSPLARSVHLGRAVVRTDQHTRPYVVDW